MYILYESLSDANDSLHESHNIHGSHHRAAQCYLLHETKDATSMEKPSSRDTNVLLKYPLLIFSQDIPLRIESEYKLDDENPRNWHGLS